MKIHALNISIINKFLVHFKTIFSKKLFVTFAYFFYAMFMTYKRASLFALSEHFAPTISYQQVQYFFSDARWSIDKLNDIRFDLLCHSRTTAPSRDSLLAIDDTSCPKPYAKKTEGAHWQHCGSLKREEICNVAVFSSVVSKNKAIPVRFKSYLPACEFASSFDPKGTNHPDFKSKLALAKELLLEAKQSQHLSFITQYNFDSWYASSDILETVHYDLKGSFFSELKAGRTLHFHHPVRKKSGFFKIEELVKLFEEHYSSKFKKVHITRKDGLTRSLWTYSFNSMLKDCSVPIKVVVVFGSWGDDDSATFHAIITNDKSARTHTVIESYLLRWGIERVFQEMKDVCYFDHYQVRHTEKIERWWSLSMLAWTFLFWVRQNAFLAKMVEPSVPLRSLNDCRRVIEQMLSLASSAFVSNNPTAIKNLYKFISKNFLHKISSRKVA
jgi:hypothetical protein